MHINKGNHSRFRAVSNARGQTRQGLLWVIGVAAFLFTAQIAVSFAFAANQLDEATRREQLFQIRSKQIPLLEQFLKKYPDSPRIPDSLFRLGEAHYEVGKYYQANGNQKQADSEIKRSISILEDLRHKYPSFKNLDASLFALANAYFETEQNTKAGEVLVELSEKFPKSPIVKEAALLLGDYYFNKNQNAKAESYYQIALQDPRNQSYVNYKLAWTSLNENQPARALKFFERVLAIRGQAAANAGGDYTRDAAREMIFAAFQVYGAKGVVSYLDKVLKDPELLQMSAGLLGKSLLDKSQYAAASQIFEQLQSRFHDSPQYANWVGEEVKAEAALDHTAKVRNLIQRLQTETGDAQQVEAFVLNSAKKYHAEARKATSEPERNHYFDVAIGYYKAYLEKAAPDQPLTNETKFFLAEALYDRQKFAEASVNYEAVAKVPSKYQAQSAWAWFLSEEKLAEGFRHKGKSVVPPGPHDLRYLEAARSLQETPGITLAQKRKASYQTARLLYQINDIDNSLPVFKYLAEHQSRSEEGKLSAQLVLDIYNQKKDYRAIADYAHAYEQVADSSSKSEFKGLEEKAALKAIQQEEIAAKAKFAEPRDEALEEVATHYRQFAETYPHSEFADACLWASVENFAAVAADRNDKTFENLRSAFHELIKKFPSSPKAKLAVNLMAKFLRIQKVDPAVLQEFHYYRPQWVEAMREAPASERGTMGMLVWKLSNETQRRALMKEFEALPFTEANREAYSYGRLAGIQQTKAKIESISLASRQGLGRKTQQKIHLLEVIQKEVTALVKLKVAEPAIQGLQLLADSYLNMATALRSAPVPANLKGAAREQYQSAVESKAKIFEDKGNEARNLAEQKASELKLSS